MTARRRSALDGTARSPAVRSTTLGPTYAQHEVPGRIASWNGRRRLTRTGNLTGAEWELIAPPPKERERPGRPTLSPYRRPVPTSHEDAWRNAKAQWSAVG